MFFSIACNITSFLYPAYQSYKALSSPYPIVVSIPDSSQTQTRPPTRTEQSFEIERWLTYWVLLGLFSSIESLIGWTISWIPFYTTLKTIFFLALAVSPSSIPVPELLYGKVVKPLFEEHEEAIERGLEALRMKSTGWVVRCGSWVWSRVREGMSSAASSQQFSSSSGLSGTPYPYSSQPSSNLFSSFLPSHPDPHHNPSSTPATSPQPPTLQDPAGGLLQGAYQGASNMAVRWGMYYLPVVASGLQAAAESAQRSLGTASSSSGIDRNVPISHQQQDQQSHDAQGQASGRNYYVPSSPPQASSGTMRHASASAPSAASAYFASYRASSNSDATVFTSSLKHPSSSSSSEGAQMHARSVSSPVPKPAVTPPKSVSGSGSASGSGSGLGSGFSSSRSNSDENVSGSGKGKGGRGGARHSSWGVGSGYDEIRREDFDSEGEAGGSKRASGWFGTWSSQTPGKEGREKVE